MSNKIDPLVIKRIFPCSKRALFDAWSRPELMSRWFFASVNKIKNSKVESQFRVGGTWSVTMYFDNDDETTLHGRYLEIERYYSICFSWNSSIAQDGHVKLQIRSLSENRSELRLTHSKFSSVDNRAMHQRGWDACLANLEHFFA